jgi:hypothetical protein
MRPWAFSKNKRKADDPVLPVADGNSRRHAVTRSDDRLSGWIAWDDDPFFRPTIGVFVNRQLTQLVPTARQQREGRRSSQRWKCAFTVPLNERAQAGHIEVTCLETGELLYSERRRDPGIATGELEIDDLIEIAQAKRKGWDASGFAEFLRLPRYDQLQLLYLDIFGRHVDSLGLHQYLIKMDAGDTILDIRDSLLESDEFWCRRGAFLSIDERVGQWLIWGGLRDVSRYVMPANTAETTFGDPAKHPLVAVAEPLRSAFEQLPASVSVADYLAKLALGGCPEETRRLWQSANSESIDEVRAWVAHSRASRPKQYRSHTGDVMISGMLSMMKVGGAGQKDPATGRVRSRDRVEGHLVYGPYIRLEPGFYRLTVRMDVVAGEASPASTTGFALEACYGDLLLAWKSLPPTVARDVQYDLEFAVPSEAAELLSAAKFEFRVHSRGGCALDVGAVSLERIAPAEDLPVPAVNNWLDLLKVGSAGGLKPGGEAVCATSSEGHVVYGFYRSLLPGEYEVEASISDAVVGTFRGSIRFEVMAEGDRILVSREYVVADGKTNLSLGFSVPDAATIEKLYGPLEFRIWKAEGTTFTLDGIELASRLG